MRPTAAMSDVAIGATDSRSGRSAGRSSSIFTLVATVWAS